LRYLKNSNRFEFSKPNAIIRGKNDVYRIHCTVMNIQNSKTLLFWLGVKILKNKKRGVRMSSNRTYAQNLSKIGRKKWRSALMG
jgi:hypothetical protein